jgi:hypothetical protein
MSGRRFHECPGGIVALPTAASEKMGCSGVISGLQELDAACAQGLEQLRRG